MLSIVLFPCLPYLLICLACLPYNCKKIIIKCLGKVLALTTRDGVEDVCSISQLCSGLKSCIEGAIQALRELFAEKAGTGSGVLLVYAQNTFNSLNRVSALWTAHVLWPLRSRFLFNTYRGHAALVVYGSKECSYSRQGATQGDPFFMLFYAAAVLPLLKIICKRKHSVSDLVCTLLGLCWRID